jgi:hypothetical protein
LDKQEKVTQGAGVELPAISFSKSKAAKGGFWSFKTWVSAFAEMTAVLFGGLRQKTPSPPYMNYYPSSYPSPARGEGTVFQ